MRSPVASKRIFPTRLRAAKLILMMLICVGLAACSNTDTPTSVVPSGENGAIGLTNATLDGVTQLEGRIGPGSLYAIFVPEDWNGDLVLYAHGFIDAALPVQLPTKDDIEAIRDELLTQGFAVAYSSYSENGFAVRDGVQRTHQLGRLFASRVSRPRHTLLMGHSLGGLVAIELAEKFPGQYDGVLTLCGMIGGSRAEVDYVGDVRSLFDMFYPGVLPGTVMDLPEDADLNADIIGPALAAVQADPTGLGALIAMDQSPIPGRTPDEFVVSLLTVLGFHARGFADVFARTQGHVPYDNMDRAYTGTLPPTILGWVNATMPRFDRTPDAEAELRANYEPTGDLRIPAISIHTAYDPTVPVFHETLYAAKVAARGNQNLLEQRIIERYGHCNIFPDEVSEAILDLQVKATTSSVGAP